MDNQTLMASSALVESTPEATLQNLLLHLLPFFSLQDGETIPDLSPEGLHRAFCEVFTALVLVAEPTLPHSLRAEIRQSHQWLEPLGVEDDISKS